MKMGSTEIFRIISYFATVYTFRIIFIIFDIMRNHLVQSQSTKTQEHVHHRSTARFNRIVYSKEYIQICKHQIRFSRLSDTVKYIFVYSLKQISHHKIMKQIFHRWEDQTNLPSHAKMIFLSDQQALGLIWRMQKALQKAKNTLNLQQVRGQIQELRNKHNSIVKYLNSMITSKSDLSKMTFSAETMSESKKIQGQMQSFIQSNEEEMKSILEQINKKKEIMDRLKRRQKISFERIQMKTILFKSINKEIRNLLKQSIIFIVETTRQVIIESESQKEQVYVIFQQCYPTRKMKKNTIVKILGSKTYLEKVEKFNNFMKWRQTIHPKKRHQSKNMLCCHQCMRILKVTQLQFCKVKISENQTQSYPSTDYFSYRKMHLEGDFFYQAIQQHVIPFFQYSKNLENKLFCNRMFCQNCFSHYNHEAQQSECIYCKGSCNCSRCQRASNLVKLIAMDHKNDPQEKRSYHHMLSLFGKSHPDVSETLPLRIPGESNELKVLEKVWQACNASSPQARIDIECYPTLRYIHQIDALRRESFMDFQEDNEEQRMMNNIQQPQREDFELIMEKKNQNQVSIALKENMPLQRTNHHLQSIQFD